jgi:orotidine-5'-phosphate decarboxylase
MGFRMKFYDRLNEIIHKKDSLLTIGLDADLEKLPPFLMDFESPITEFNKSIINATSDLACAYKINTAFYEQFGIQGFRSMKKTIELIPKDVLIIIDGKRADIGHSSAKYAKALYHECHADAVTINPYLGYDSVAPFFEDESKGVFLLCLTSNSGARDFQYVKTETGKTLFELVAEKAVSWNQNGNIGLVVGGTQAEELGKIRKIAPELPILVPGIGAQGGDLKKSLELGCRKDNDGILITVSRSILYASDDLEFASKSREVAQNIKDEINRIRNRSKR